MIKINDNIFQFENLRVGQMYLIIQDEDITLVDTGMIGDLSSIKKQLSDMDISFEQINNIIITHHHMDHTFNLKKISKLSDAKIYIHEGDYDKIKNKVKELKIIMINDGDTLSILNNMEVIHVKGHTDGNIALYARDYKLLIAGDCIFNNNGFAYPPKKYNTNTEVFMKNVRRLLDYDIKVICPGHGLYVDENCKELLEKLIK